MKWTAARVRRLLKQQSPKIRRNLPLHGLANSHTPASPPSRLQCDGARGALKIDVVVSANRSCALSLRNPAALSACLASGADMNVFQTNPLRAFSAIRTVAPTSIPSTSALYQPLAGLNA